MAADPTRSGGEGEIAQPENNLTKKQLKQQLDKEAASRRAQEEAEAEEVQQEDDIYDVEAEAEAEKELRAVIDGKLCDIKIKLDTVETFEREHLHALVDGKSTNVFVRFLDRKPKQTYPPKPKPFKIKRKRKFMVNLGYAYNQKHRKNPTSLKQTVAVISEGVPKKVTKKQLQRKNKSNKKTIITLEKKARHRRRL